MYGYGIKFIIEKSFCGPMWFVVGTLFLWSIHHTLGFQSCGGVYELNSSTKNLQNLLGRKKLKRKKKTNWCWSVFYFYPALTFSSGKRNVNLREKTEYYSAYLLSSFMLFLCLCVICFAWNCFGIHRICTTFNFDIDISNEQQHPNIVK